MLRNLFKGLFNRCAVCGKQGVPDETLMIWNGVYVCKGGCEQEINQPTKSTQKKREKLEGLPTYEEYVAGTACIGLSPYCKGRKSREAIVCKNCYLAQGFDRPIGFAQSGGGATKDELGQMVVARLGYHRIGPGQWRWD